MNETKKRIRKLQNKILGHSVDVFMPGALRRGMPTKKMIQQIDEIEELRQLIATTF